MGVISGFFCMILGYMGFSILLGDIGVIYGDKEGYVGLYGGYRWRFWGF